MGIDENKFVFGDYTYHHARQIHMKLSEEAELTELGYHSSQEIRVSSPRLLLKTSYRVAACVSRSLHPVMLFAAALLASNCAANAQSGLSGVVLEANGKPANSTTVVLVYGNEAPGIEEKKNIQVTGPDGWFIFPEEPQMRGVVAMAPTGCSWAPITRLATNSTIQLEPWAITEGHDTASLEALAQNLSSSLVVNEWLCSVANNTSIPNEYRKRKHLDNARPGDPRDDSKWALIRRGTNAWPAIPLLVERLLKPDTDKWDLWEKLRVAQVLAGLRADESPYWPEIKAKLANLSEPVEALQTLFLSSQKSDLPWHGPIRFDPTVGRFALSALTAIGPAAKSVLPDLLKCARECNDATRPAVFAAIEAQGPEALPSLNQLLQDAEAIPPARIAAGEAIIRIQPTNTAVLATFREGLRDKNGTMRVESAGGLYRLGVEVTEYLPVLTNALTHKRPSVRCAALEVLGAMGQKARSARQIVQSRTADENEKVRKAATEALKASGG